MEDKDKIDLEEIFIEAIGGEEDDDLIKNTFKERLE